MDGSENRLQTADVLRHAQRAEACTVRSVQSILPPDLEIERELFKRGANLIACVDEAGRGPLAGGVHVGVVVLHAGHTALTGVDDSKRLSDSSRERLVPLIEAWAVSAVASASASEIDRHGVMGSLRLALRRALAALPSLPDAVVLDGPYDFLHRPEPVAGEPWTGSMPSVVTLPHGDRLSAGVAAASILAKTSRDAEMRELDRSYPGYGWAMNKGYGTSLHKDAIKKLGLTPEHRRTFRLT